MSQEQQQLQTDCETLKNSISMYKHKYEQCEMELETFKTVMSFVFLTLQILLQFCNF